MEHFNKADIGIFWDVDDCPIPESLNALMVSQNMRLALGKLSYHGKVFIHAYGDTNNILDDLNPSSVDKISTPDFRKASISATNPTVVVKETPDNNDYRGTTSIYTEDDLESTPTLMLNHSSGNKEAMLGRILVDLMMWAVDHPAPAQIILVLGNNITKHEEEFTNALSQVSILSYNVHFAYPQNSVCTSLPGVNIKWLWESLSLGGNPHFSIWEKMIFWQKKMEEEDEEEEED